MMVMVLVGVGRGYAVAGHVEDGVLLDVQLRGGHARDRGAGCDDVRVSVRVDPERAGVPLRVTPPLDSPVSRMCRRFGWAVSLSDSLKVMASLRRCPSSRRPT